MVADSSLKLIVGLGNPGTEYEGTRHNAGFDVVEKLLKTLPGTFKMVHAFSGYYWQGRCRGRNLFIQKPLTYMNLSGRAVAPLMRKGEIQPEEILLVFDDMDLPLGKIRLRKGGGGSGGHNGVESVIKETGSSNFSRLRIGIGKTDGPDQKDHVLSKFNDSENEIYQKVIDKSVEATKLALYRGVGAAMNEYNGLFIENESDDKNENKDDENK
jgi:peptidyl-tRNA hydrolase, PTH1 family